MPVGQLEGFSGARALFASDLAANVASGLAFEAELRRRFDEHAGAEPEPERGPRLRRSRAARLDLAGVGAIVLGNGLRPDYGWIELPVLGGSNTPCIGAGSRARPRLRRNALAAQAECRSSSASARTPSTSSRSSSRGQAR